ncbi:MAG: hypothetical protein KF708_19335 [Pirellulales bacterium]|nr:hypothetical protein [Pirellulales bacterium]
MSTTPARGTRLPWRFLSTLVIVGLIVWSTRGMQDDSQQAELPPVAKTPPAAAPSIPASAPPAGLTDEQAASPELAEATAHEPQAERAPATDVTPAGAPNADDWADLRDELETVEDRTTSIHPIEMPAYYRLLEWSEAQSDKELLAAARQETFHDLVHHPAKHRAELVEVKLRVRRALRYELPENNPLHDREVYELWGWPSDSRGWLYVVLTPELPPGVKVGDQIDADVTAVGYFFKLQGYQPAQAKPGATPLVAPLLIGRVIPERRTPVAVSKNERWALVLLGVAAVIAVFAACMGSLTAFRSLRRRSQGATLAPESPLAEPELDLHNTDNTDDDRDHGPNRDDYWWLSPHDGNAPPYADR